MEEIKEVVCPNCGSLNKKENDFCSDCGAPLTPYAAIDPIKRIKTYGFIYRRLASGNVNKVVLIGAWFIFFTPFIIALFFFFKFKNWYEIIFSFGYAIIVGRLLFLLTKNYLNKNDKS